MNNKKIKNGFSLVEILVGIGLIGIVSVGTTILVHNVQKVQVHLDGKSEVATIEIAAQALLSRKEDCGCQFKDKTFDSTNANSIIELTTLKISCVSGAADFISTPAQAGSLAENKVSRMFISEIQSTGNSNEYIGQLFLEPLNSKLKIKIKPSPIRVRFNTVQASPANAKVINSCGGVSVSTPRDLVATDGNRSCILNWSPSTGSNVTYRIKMSKVATQASVGINVCNDVVATTCQVNNLENGQRYYFSAQAYNTSESSPSWSSEATCLPLEPVNTPVIAATPADRSCSIVITRPTLGTPPITYTVYSSTGPTVTTASNVVCSNLAAGTASQTTCVASGLTNYQAYKFGVVASNAAGPAPMATVDCVPPGVCTGNPRVTLIFPGGCRKGRITGNYTLTLNNVESGIGGSRYFIRSQVYVRKHHPCKTVYCPINFTCSGSTLVQDRTNMSCPSTPLAGTLVGTYPDQFYAAGDNTNGWRPVQLYKRP